MFNWFQRLLPKKGDFFGMFEAHAATLVAAQAGLIIGLVLQHVRRRGPNSPCAKASATSG